jgi:hypothetical protein
MKLIANYSGAINQNNPKRVEDRSRRFARIFIRHEEKGKCCKKDEGKGIKDKKGAYA